MGANSKIEWTDHTFNAWVGCEEVNPACDHCYAREYAKRWNRAVWGASGTRSVASEVTWKKPLVWNEEALRKAERARVFCQSLSDLFEDWKGAMLDHQGRRLWIDRTETFGGWIPESPGYDFRNVRPIRMDDVRFRAFHVIQQCTELDWLLLTKRPGNIAPNWPMVGFPDAGVPGSLGRRLHLSNVWLGTSVPNQEWADKLIPDLIDCKDFCAGLFLSIEPMLGPIDLSRFLGGYRWKRGDIIGDGMEALVPSGPEIKWVIAGGESGKDARAVHPDWIRSLRDQCQAARIPFFFKQWGEWLPMGQGGLLAASCEGHPDFTAIASFSDGRQVKCRNNFDGGESFCRVGKKTAGAMLDGREWRETPFQVEASA